MHEEAVLSEFFHTLLEESEAGYVLKGKKPVCINGFNLQDRFLTENAFHKMSVYLKEGANVWKKHNFGKYKSGIIVHVYNKGDSLVKNCVHVLVIHRDLFINTVNSNLPLFQYVLGPEITASSLLDKLTDPEQTFYDVLKDDKVLIGIILGFGTQNALYGSRLENLEESCMEVDLAPFKSKAAKIVQKNPHLKDLVLLSSHSDEQSKNLKPSFGYSTLQEEISKLREKIEISSQKLASGAPYFIFGRLKNDAETNRLVHELEETQEKIAKQLNMPTFLTEALKQIFPNEEINVNKSDDQGVLFTFDHEDTRQLPNLVALNIFNNLRDEKAEYIEAFFLGMKDFDTQITLDESPPHSLDYEINKTLLEAHQNLLLSNAKFRLLDHDEQFKCLVPLSLYYRTLKEGKGRKLSNQTSVVLKYTIMTPDNETLCDLFTAKSLDLSETISGFAYGVRGMHVGEIREIFIHPTLAYGLYTSFEKGIYLQAIVQLIDIDKEDASKAFPELVYADFLQDIKPDLEETYKTQAREVGYYSGYNAWKHYKLESQYYLDEVVETLNRLRKGEEITIPPSVNFQKVINQLHWNIYKLKQDRGDTNSLGKISAI